MARTTHPSTNPPDPHFERRRKQALAGTHLPTERELLRGMGFFLDNVREDIRECAGRFARHIRRKGLQGYESVLELLDDLAMAPSMDALGLLEAQLTSFPDWAAIPAKSWRTRCRIYRAASGDADAAALVAAEIAALGFEDIRSAQGQGLMWLSLGWAVHSRRMEDWHGTGARISFAKNHHREDVGDYANEFRQAFGLTSEIGGASEPGGSDARRPDETANDAESQSAEGVVVFRTIGMGTARGGADVGRDYEELLDKALPLSPIPDLGLVRERLLKEFPYASPVIETVLHDVAGGDYVHIRPTMLVGPPGAGKSHFARRLAEELKTPWEMIPCGGVHDAMHGGSSRKWSTSEPSLPVAVIRSRRHAGPIILLDEIEKVGNGRYNGNLHDVLHGLLERETAARWRDPYIDAPCDLSHISWIMTANTVEPVPKSLRDRCRCIRFSEPGPEHLPALAQQLLSEMYREKGFEPQWAIPLDGVEIEALSTAWPGGSIRALQRILERLIHVREVSMTRC